MENVTEIRRHSQKQKTCAGLTIIIFKFLNLSHSALIISITFTVYRRLSNEVFFCFVSFLLLSQKDLTTQALNSNWKLYGNLLSVIIILTTEDIKLWELIDKLVKESRKKGQTINGKKIDYLVISKADSPRWKIRCGGARLKTVQKFIHLRKSQPKSVLEQRKMLFAPRTND